MGQQARIQVMTDTIYHSEKIKMNIHKAVSLCNMKYINKLTYGIKKIKNIMYSPLWNPSLDLLLLYLIVYCLRNFPAYRQICRGEAFLKFHTTLSSLSTYIQACLIPQLLLAPSHLIYLEKYLFAAISAAIVSVTTVCLCWIWCYHLVSVEVISNLGKKVVAYNSKNLVLLCGF